MVKILLIIIESSKDYLSLFKDIKKISFTLENGNLYKYLFIYLF